MLSVLCRNRQKIRIAIITSGPDHDAYGNPNYRKLVRHAIACVTD